MSGQIAITALQAAVPSFSTLAAMETTNANYLTSFARSIEATVQLYREDSKALPVPVSGKELVNKLQKAALHIRAMGTLQAARTRYIHHNGLFRTQFRDGNVPAGHEQLCVFIRAPSLLPGEITDVRLRSRRLSA